ncbi:MAG: DUF2207 domain-containing protein [Clostridia bacterium]|nr:DUF2207 domain-containing protein [Clostridia bacterium]
MIIFILINIAIIIYILFKYYNFEKTDEITKEEIESYDSIFIEYIKYKDINNSFDTLIAEIVDLSAKGYVKIEYDQDVKDKYNYTIILNVDEQSGKLTKYETLVLNFLFYNKMEITKSELEQRLKNTYKTFGIQYKQMKQSLREKAIKEKVIDVKKEKELPKIKKVYIIISIIIFIIMGILGTINIININLYEIGIFIFEQILTIILLSQASFYTNKGQNLKYAIDAYKIEIENKEFFENKNTMQEIVKDKEFAKSVALHINTLAKRTFADNLGVVDASYAGKKSAIIAFIFLSVLVTIGLIIAKLSATLPKDVVVWIYILFAIAMAVMADITFNKKK